MNDLWFAHLGWIAAAAVLGFVVSWVFSGLLRLLRNTYLIVFIGSTLLLFYAYIRWSGLPVGEMISHNWVWGLLGAVLLSLINIRHVLSQPASSRAKGLNLAFDLFWPGFMYGMTDAVLLSVLPVMAVWQAFTLLNWTASWPGKILVGIIAVLASILVTSAYHLGYPEFRRREKMITANFGNTVMTLGYLRTNNPLAAILCHSAMHMVAVLHGPEQVVQLPPHYQS